MLFKLLWTQWSQWSQVTAAVFLLALLAPISVAAKPDKAPSSVAVLDSLTGGSTISQGDVVYVDFWASWCVPCKRSFPWMIGLAGKYGEKGLQVVTINLDQDVNAARKFLKDTGASLPIVFDPSGKLAKLYDLQVMPTSFLYARDGTLRLRKEGFDPKEIESTERLIEKLLKEKPGK
ncbi:MAG: TlpA disulfide reductase family protein [bacterium]